MGIVGTERSGGNREVRWEQSAQDLVSTAYGHHREVAQDDRKLVGSFQQTAKALTKCTF